MLSTRRVQRFADVLNFARSVGHFTAKTTSVGDRIVLSAHEISHRRRIGAELRSQRRVFGKVSEKQK
ncbi:hypothetical protein B4U79_07374 [Dinothrombium tinctorium]|uniref:Uncharacterized protein n=1 Tax=Dinothrombium tinctorium TaxID=1965070 RepID=A0A443R9L0_9ACAR|nr:hypothetical protein B4U79_07374 [Dinothrombium tinctorium]